MGRPWEATAVPLGNRMVFGRINVVTSRGGMSIGFPIL